MAVVGECAVCGKAVHSSSRGRLLPGELAVHFGCWEEWETMLKVTDDQIVACIRVFLEKRGYPPTVREIMTGVGLRSTAAVSYRLDMLVERGRIERDYAVPRGIRLVGGD